MPPARGDNFTTYLAHDWITEEIYSSKPFTGTDHAVYYKKDIICKSQRRHVTPWTVNHLQTTK